MKDSLRKRYFFKLAANLVGFAVSLVTQAIIPRGLGPKAYGDFTFLSNFFTEIVGFLDMGTSIGFYTKLSQNHLEHSLVRFYLYLSALVSLGVITLLIVAQTSTAYRYLWPDQELFFVYLAALWGIMAWFVQVLTKMADAYGLTVSMEVARMGQKGLGLVLIFVLFLAHALNLTTLFLYHYVIMAVVIGVLIWILESRGYSLKKGWNLSWLQVKHYTKEFYDYSHPLFVYALAGLIVGLFDRWLLQVFNGSEEQGFYGLSYQIGTLCFLFTSAMSQLLIREFAIAFGRQDLQQMAQLFRRYIPLLYSIAAYFSCFIVAQASKVIYIVGGKNFSGAFFAVTLMALYPIHQTYGQLSGSVFYATGQTALYRNIGIVLMLFGLPITFFIIAPHDWGGLNAGAAGLAIKMLLLQFVGVNVQLYFNSRLLRLRFWRYLKHQLFSVGCFLTLAFLVKVGVDNVFALHCRVFTSFILAGFSYTILVVVMTCSFPLLFGLSRQDLHSLFQLARQKCGFT
jgi:O-antigen/teichoic acid export membrane protein